MTRRPGQMSRARQRVDRAQLVVDRVLFAALALALLVATRPVTEVWF